MGGEILTADYHEGIKIYRKDLRDEAISAEMQGERELTRLMMD